MQRRLSILIPVFNEATTLAQILQRIWNVRFPQCWLKEIIIINDGSTDETLSEIQKFSRHCTDECVMKVLTNDRNVGKGASLRRGISMASGDAIMIQDADLEYQPFDYLPMLEALDRGADVVYGSRFKRSRNTTTSRITTPMHRLINWALTLFSNIFTGLELTDVHTCLKLFRKEVIKNLVLEEDGFGFCPEVTAKLGQRHDLNLVEVPISYNPRSKRFGKKVAFQDGLRAIYCTLKYSLAPNGTVLVDSLGTSRCFAFICFFLILSLLTRLIFFCFRGTDYNLFLSPWYDFLIQHGAWHGLGQMTTQISDYPPLYLYLLSLSTILPIPKLFAIKLLSTICDYIAAFVLWRLAKLLGANSFNAICAALLFLFLPTVVMNSAIWGQCDVMYTLCLLLSLFYVFNRCPRATLIAFGFACSLKPQAIFWCPFLLGLLVSRRISWKVVWIAPAVYISTLVPAILAGRPILDAILHWARVRNIPGLNHHAPNWYQWVSTNESLPLYITGIVLAIAAIFLIGFWREKSGNSNEMGARRLIKLAFLSVAVLPFCLPGMHERYFYAADVCSILCALTMPYGWVVVLTMQFASAFAYCPFLFHVEPVPEIVLPAAVLLAIEWVLLADKLTSKASCPFGIQNIAGSSKNLQLTHRKEDPAGERIDDFPSV